MSKNNNGRTQSNQQNSKGNKGNGKQGNRRREREKISDHPEAIQRRRDALQRELNSRNIKPISFEIFKKTPEEKVKLKNAKASHKRMMQRRDF